MTEPSEPDGAEATFAPGEDLSFKSTELLLEEMASTMLGAEIEDAYKVHYDQLAMGGAESHSVECRDMETAVKNAQTLTKSPTVLPLSIKVTSQRTIHLPEIVHPLEAEEVKPAPRWTPPKVHPNIPTS
jgi:hypothetical protein